MRYLDACGLFECADQLEYGNAAPCAEIIYFERLARGIVQHPVNGNDMRLGQVYHVNVVPYAGAVRSVIVVSEDTQFFTYTSLDRKSVV